VEGEGLVPDVREVMVRNSRRSGLLAVEIPGPEIPHPPPPAKARRTRLRGRPLAVADHVRVERGAVLLNEFLGRLSLRPGPRRRISFSTYPLREAMVFRVWWTLVRLEGEPVPTPRRLAQVLRERFPGARAVIEGFSEDTVVSAISRTLARMRGARFRQLLEMVEGKAVPPTEKELRKAVNELERIDRLNSADAGRPGPSRGMRRTRTPPRAASALQPRRRRSARGRLRSAGRRTADRGPPQLETRSGP